MQRILQRTWAKNQALEQIVPIVDKAESSRVKKEALQARVKELEFEFRDKTNELRNLERTHKSEVEKLQAENKELRGIVECRSPSSCF